MAVTHIDELEKIRTPVKPESTNSHVPNGQTVDLDTSTPVTSAPTPTGTLSLKERASQQVQQIITSNDPARIYTELIPLLASLPGYDYDLNKEALKNHFKRKVSITRLDNAVKAYRKSQSRHKLTAKREKSARPVIETGGHLRDMRHAALTALAEWNNPPRIFVQSGRLVTIATDERKKPVVKEISLARLQNFMSDSADYVNVSSVADEVRETPCFPPLDVVRAVMEGYSPHEYPFPPLMGITELPIVREDGSICQAPGYDVATGYVYLPGGLVIPEIAESPTSEEVKKALELLEHWIGDFPFVDDASRATILAMAITVVIRLAIEGQVPLCLMDAPKQGTGKTILPMAIGILATGKQATPQPPTQDEEEMRKRILTWLQQSPALVLIDNITYVLESSALNTVLTSPTFGDRLLSTNINITVENRAAWFATGNNLRTGDDTARRCIKCRMDAKVERPFRRDIKQFRIQGGEKGFFRWTQENRPLLIAACLTLFRYWHIQGRKEPDVTPLGSFEDWTTTIGGILQAAGVPGFLANLDDTGSIDDISAEWTAFFEAIHHTMGSLPFTLQALAKEMLTDSDDALNNMLPASLAKSYSAYRRSDGVDRDFAVHMGYAFRARRDQVYNGYALKQSGKDRTGKALWAIVRETSPDGNDTPDSTTEKASSKSDVTADDSSLQEDKRKRKNLSSQATSEDDITHSSQTASQKSSLERDVMGDNSRSKAAPEGSHGGHGHGHDLSTQDTVTSCNGNGNDSSVKQRRTHVHELPMKLTPSDIASFQTARHKLKQLGEDEYTYFQTMSNGEVINTMSCIVEKKESAIEEEITWLRKGLRLLEKEVTK